MCRTSLALRPESLLSVLGVEAEEVCETVGLSWPALHQAWIEESLSSLRGLVRVRQCRSQLVKWVTSLVN